jgi:glycerol-3-phosphate O-acyltransferase
MDSQPQLSPEAFAEALRAEFEAVCRQVAQAVNQAPAGQVINASEEKVRDLFADFRQKAYEQALQMRLDAAEAAFPPSAPPADRPAPAEQGARAVHRPDRQ